MFAVNFESEKRVELPGLEALAREFGSKVFRVFGRAGTVGDVDAARAIKVALEP